MLETIIYVIMIAGAVRGLCSVLPRQPVIIVSMRKAEPPGQPDDVSGEQTEW